MHDRTRREWLKEVGAAGAGTLLTGARAQASANAETPLQTVPAAANGTLLPLTSSSDVFIPPRGRAFQKFSFDFPEPAVTFEGFSFAFRVFTGENTYTLDRNAIVVTPADGAVAVSCTRFAFAGGQQTTAARLTGRLSLHTGAVHCDVEAEMDRPITAIATIVRGVPRGRMSAGGAPWFDPRNDEVLLGYPFSGSDLFGPQGNGGLTTPLVFVERAQDSACAISALDDRVRTKRFYFQPGETGYRVECLVESEAWHPQQKLVAPTWVIAPHTTISDAAAAHYGHVATAFAVPAWETRPDVPDWMKRTALVVTLHGMHYSGYVFNDYARMLDILRWMATRIPAERVLAFLAAWDGRYYWDYPIYRPSDRMGGERGFRSLIADAQALGFKMMPMFGANAANRRQASFARFADAATARVDGDRFDLNWVDWNNDRHQDGWLSYMNLGVASWRTWLSDRIADVLDRYRVDAYFLDIAGGWVNNPSADMHAGARRLVEELRRRFPHVAAVGEMHYDALLGVIPMYHSFGQTLVTDHVQRYAKFFQHLSHPAPGRGSSGVHESGFARWNSQTLSLTDAAIPTLNIVDDTFDSYRTEMDAVIQAAKRRAGV
jgi:hypothetical protein